MPAMKRLRTSVRCSALRTAFGNGAAACAVGCDTGADDVADGVELLVSGTSGASDEGSASCAGAVKSVAVGPPAVSPLLSTTGSVCGLTSLVAGGLNVMSKAVGVELTEGAPGMGTGGDTVPTGLEGGAGMKTTFTSDPVASD